MFVLSEKQNMKTILILIAAISLVSCSKNDDSAPIDPIYGDWYYRLQGSSSSNAGGILGELKSDGTINVARISGSSDGQTATVYVRKSIGTFERNGDEFRIKYSYETCNPVGQETLYLKVVDDKLLLQNSDKTVAIYFARSTENSSLTNMALIEDKNCDKMAKVENKTGRIPASTKPKSIFDGINK